MAERSVATVFGGSGFIGRYLVKRLAQAGHVVRVAVRDTEAAQFLKPMGALGQIVLLRAPITDTAAVARAVAGADIVVNLVGILAERAPGDFQRIHADAAGAVARAAAAAGVGHLVHLSAIGADPANPSRYAQSKAAGEAQVLAAFLQATILRPSVVFGDEDGFFNRFAAMGQMLPVMPVISGDTRLQPVYVGDVADAIVAALGLPAARGAIFELAGPRVASLRELQAWILSLIERKRPLLDVPPGLAAVQAKLFERLPGKLLTTDQLLLLGRDNVATAAHPGLSALGIAATPMELVVPRYLARYRPGGRRRGDFAPA